MKLIHHLRNGASMGLLEFMAISTNQFAVSSNRFDTDAHTPRNQYFILSSNSEREPLSEDKTAIAYEEEEERLGQEPPSQEHSPTHNGGFTDKVAPRANMDIIDSKNKSVKYYTVTE